jgi:phage-related protein
MPLCRALVAGLLELRVHLTGERIARVMVVPFEGRLVAVNGFVKKTQATPKSELDLARRRQRVLERKKR